MHNEQCQIILRGEEIFLNPKDRSVWVNCAKENQLNTMQRIELSHLNELQSRDVKQDTFCTTG
jgi:hypothetical protein